MQNIVHTRKHNTTSHRDESCCVVARRYSQKDGHTPPNALHYAALLLLLLLQRYCSTLLQHECSRLARRFVARKEAAACALTSFNSRCRALMQWDMFESTI
ncbi:unnamed protein product [Toxocara canis]|uniref:Secreted protein n=1 Tax=Toxocara canis TaxID=6265 RepID=A0A183VDJ3_TOXCA|nr:unnamed protein product [Toxocara canis]